MAHRALQGRLQLAEQQVRMYREAMEHLMAAPPSKTSSTTRPPEEETNLRVKSTASCDGEGKPADAGQNGKEGSNGTTTRGAVLSSIGPGGDVGVMDTYCNGRYPLRSNIVKFRGSTAARTRSSYNQSSGNSNVWGLIKEVKDEISHIKEAPMRWATQSRASQEHFRLLDDVNKTKKRREAVSRERELLARRRAELARCRAELLSRRIVQEARRSDVAEARENCRSRRALYSAQLVSAMRMGALNDCFHIWHLGPFATINGFRLGRLSTHLVDWQEVNAGVGQAAIVLVSAVAMSMGVEFSKYLIAPCGSFTKIARSGDGRVLYSLHTDESFSLFPRRNFNLALKAFLHCLGD
ncbi:unnamed protein product, partial [Laminaria digitata]